FGGIFLRRNNGSIETIADWETPAPGLPGFLLRDFGTPSVHGENVAFTARYFNPITFEFRNGLFARISGKLVKILAQGDTLDGRTVGTLRSLHTNKVALLVRFAEQDGVETTAAYVATINAGPADTDHDGLPDLFERYFGTDPTTPGGNPLTVVRSGSALVLRWPEGNPAGLTVTPQWSPDLRTWLASGQSAPGVPARTIIVTSPAPGQRQAALPVADADGLSLRLLLEPTP
ncbi:MAG: thrombospondin type 3 repeat-containing protein, partial [Verrucomicrobia bacterium]|nr:thrombospondin type 3 repeat-containing protein [Verrucomicrobiota bacterium]